MTPDQIRNTRLSAGLTQREIASRMGVLLRTYQRWEQTEGSNCVEMSAAMQMLFKIKEGVKNVTD